MPAFAAGDKLTAAKLNQAAENLISRGRRGTSSSTTTTIIGVLRLDDIPLKAGYSYLITASVHLDSTVAADRVRAEIR